MPPLLFYAGGSMLGDLCNIRNRVRSLDKNLDMFYIGNGMYEITHNGMHFMSVSHEDLNGGTVNKVREIIYKNVNADILAEIEANNNKIEASKQRTLDNNIEAMAKEIRPLVARME